MSDEQELIPMPETGDMRFQVGPIGEIAEDALYEEALLAKATISQTAKILITEALEVRKISRDDRIAYLAWKRGMTPEDFRRKIHTDRAEKNQDP